MMPFIAAMPKRATKPIAAEMLNAMPVEDAGPKIPPISAIGIDARGQQGVDATMPKLTYSSEEKQRERDEHGEASLSMALWKFAKVARPFQPVAAAAA